MEHIILYAICILIMRSCVPFAHITDGEIALPTKDNLISYQRVPVTSYFDAAIITFSATSMALPLWVALELLLWFGKGSGIFNILDNL